MEKLNQKNVLSATVSMLMTLGVCHSISVQASDIDIYKLPDQSKMTLFLMFDTSGSMGWGDNYGDVSNRNSASSIYQDYNICSWRNDGTSSRPTYRTDVTSESKSYQVGTRAARTYNVNYCNVSASTYNGLTSTYKTRITNECTKTSATLNTYKCYDRLSRLKMALAKVLSSSEISDTVRIGLGQFSTPTSTSETSADGVSGRVVYPAVDLSEVNRENLIGAMVALNAYNGTPSASAYGESGAYFLGKNTYGMNSSGYSYSHSDSRNGNTGYKAPVTTAEMANTCNGQGIYFLTDGIANSSNATSTKAIMNKSITLSGTGLSGGTSDAGWTEIGQFAKLLRGGSRNIKTAVVGFGKDFPNGSTYIKDLPVDILDQDGEVVETVNRRFYNCSVLPDGDIKNTCNWGAKPHVQLPSTVGGFGNGGFYSAQSTQDIVDSIKYFIDDIRPRFKPIVTGSPTLPQDTLNPLLIQPYGYYASFTPKPQESTQLWVGNMNKYHIYNGELYNSSKTIKLIRDNGALNTSANGLWTNGMKENLPLGLRTNTANEKFAKRTIYTNRQIIGTAAPFSANEANSLKKVNVATLFGADSTALFINDPDKNYWLNLLGYDVGATETGVTLENLAAKPELRQVGAIMHSTPILLTQRGKITYTSGTIDTTDRDDYLLFGSTQGLLHVVDADTGIEKFAFAPNEMMQNPNQKAAFLSETSSTGGKNKLFYGIDAPWTAYTQYVSKADDTLTVSGSDRTSDGSSNSDLTLKGLQWVYGGLRMGGRSYYALDLSDLDDPRLKFHIDPDHSKIYKSNTTTSGVTALSYMGQSWSKPTLAYVKFGGTKKLVMFVGGGYDSGYENAAYDQSATTGSGAGVYMFDANTGDLLWWASANATSAGGAEAFTNTSATTINMKYSVVSQINAIDRDDDGLVDNLYFGDLGGQAFRVDLNNNVNAKSSFATRVVRLFTEPASGGASPRFYEMPSVSIHEDNGYIAAVAFSSGNRSSPLVGTAVTGSNQAGSTVSAADGVFVVYDKDVAKPTLYDTSPAPTLTTQNITLTSLNTNIGTGVSVAGNNGWKYIYSSTAGVYKGMNELYALDGMLYVNVYHRDGTGISGSCGAGVKGDSYIYQFCLPTGKCSFATTIANTPNRVKLGAGILGSGLGQDLGSIHSKLVVTRPDSLECTTAANKNKPECQKFSTAAKLRQLRWYETR
ncbi:pilus assembly protein [Acinetobacter terrestris]|uniref:pilus assembly protein n=1 Tax=Acinetobacter terrestris TaxID=2529843 RepID=UPI00103CF1BF|nr:PilC/PilY family type IV pilus protein [Acinetobacter terrestris]TCB56167.1 pilus assembly protein PilY [Acinetobacter terrestris]